MIDKKIFLIICGFLVIFIFLYFNKTPIVTILNSSNLLPKEETFTELYFEDHLSLPKTIEPDTEYTFRFTVHNLEHKDFTYTYDVVATATDSATMQVLDENKFTLKHDEFKTIRETFSLPEPIETSKIVVNLKSKNQSIHFLTIPVVQ